jgi:hypothetical protein
MAIAQACFYFFQSKESKLTKLQALIQYLESANIMECYYITIFSITYQKKKEKENGFLSHKITENIWVPYRGTIALSANSVSTSS